VPSNPDPVILNELNMKEVLSDLLGEKTFLPGGGTIGFGRIQDKGSFESFLNYLKGSDAAIRRLCASLGLDLIYKKTFGSVLILLDQFVEFGYVDTAFQSLIEM
jgi:hypothetical protein